MKHMIIGGLLAFAALVGGCMWGMPQYNIYAQRLAGQAEFERAEQNRKIKVEEAKAINEAAQLLAEAEQTKAKGAAIANAILVDNLGGPENYLKWRWIEMLEGTGKYVNREVIYVPTGGDLPIPITEAGRVAGWKPTVLPSDGLPIPPGGEPSTTN